MNNALIFPPNPDLETHLDAPHDTLTIEKKLCYIVSHVPLKSLSAFLLQEKSSGWFPQMSLATGAASCKQEGLENKRWNGVGPAVFN